PQPERIERIVWGRDREGKFGDRVATRYRIEAARATNAWQLVARSDDREPFRDSTRKPAGPAYRFEAWPETEATQGRAWLAELQQVRKQRETLAQAPMAY